MGPDFEIDEVRSTADRLDGFGVPYEKVNYCKQQGSADSRISESLRHFPSHDPRFWALIAVAARSQKVEMYHVKNRRL